MLLLFDGVNNRFRFVEYIIYYPVEFTKAFLKLLQSRWIDKKTIIEVTDKWFDKLMRDLVICHIILKICSSLIQQALNEKFNTIIF